jgi:hypothetical protein
VCVYLASKHCWLAAVQERRRAARVAAACPILPDFSHCHTNDNTTTHKQTVGEDDVVRVEFIYEPPQSGSPTELVLERHTGEEQKVRPEA